MTKHIATTAGSGPVDESWLAHLELEIGSRNGKSVVTKSRQEGPLTIQSPFYPEGDVCHLYLLHPPAGVVGGDSLELDVSVVDGGATLLTTPGATKFYRTNGKVARQHQLFRIQKDCSLEWLPQETIYFPDANAQLNTEIHLQPGAHFIGWEIHCLGLPANGLDFGHGKAKIGMHIYRDNNPIFIDSMYVTEAKRKHQAAFLRDKQITATFVATSVEPATLEELRESLPQGEHGVLAATLLDDLLVLRYLGESTNEARKLFLRAWQKIRPNLLHREANLPRIWAT